MALASLLVGAFAATAALSGESPACGEGGPSAEKFIVVIDPGHGGRDHGCLGADHKEKELALRLSQAFGDEIKASLGESVEVIYTRTADVFVPLHERAAIANRVQADLFISIHCNYLPGHGSINGSETYVMGLHTAEHNLDVAKRENAAVRLEVDAASSYAFDPDSPAGHIILSMFQHAFQEKSLSAATAIEESLGARSGRQSRGVLQAGFVVLKDTAMPSVLVETGYLSNADEELYLSSEAGIQATARALYEGFARYMRSEQRANGDTPRPQLTSIQQLQPNLVEPTAATSTAVGLDATTADGPYYVQLTTSEATLDTRSAQWKDLGADVHYIIEDGVYKYRVGPFTSEGPAARQLEAARAAGFVDALVMYRGRHLASEVE